MKQSFFLPELPWDKKQRLMEKYNLSSAQTHPFLEDYILAELFEQTIKIIKDRYQIDNHRIISLTYNYLVNDFCGIRTKEGLSWEQTYINPTDLAKIIVYLFQNKITSAIAKEMLFNLTKYGTNPDNYLKPPPNETSVQEIVQEIIKNNPQILQDYHKGKKNVVNFIIGECLKKNKNLDIDLLTNLITKILTSK